MKTAEAKRHDPYLQRVADYTARPRGLTVIEAWRGRPGKRLTRTAMLGHRVAERTAKVPAGFILCPGAVAIRITETGLVEHLAPWNVREGEFAGFVVTPLEHDRALLQEKGCYVLRIPENAGARPGAKVFASNINSFNTEGDGLEIGLLLHRENYGGGVCDSWQVLWAAGCETLDLDRARAAGCVR